MKTTPYIVVSVLVMITYYYALFRYNAIIKRVFPEHLATNKIKALKQFIYHARGTELETEGKKALMYFNVARYSIVFGVGAYLLIMILER